LHTELLIAAGPGEWRAALLEDGCPVELFVERGGRSEAGSIHLGRVCRLVPALDAALVDIGEERPSFLPQGATVPRGRRLQEGERVLVQIRRETQGGKAARLTMAIALRRRFVELIVGQPGLTGSEALTSGERARLLEALDPRTPSALRAGFPLSRIAGEGPERSEGGEGAAGLRLLELAPVDVLIAEGIALRRSWHAILSRAARLDPPARIYPVASFAAVLAGALPQIPSRIRVDEPGSVPDVRAAFPDTAVEHLQESEWPIDLDAVFAEAISTTIALPIGGSAHFETTRAGVLIDVDTGTPQTGVQQRVAVAVNLTAAAAIARQIRLRNLGGGIVIDFVGLEQRTSRDRVRAALAEALAADPRNPQILGWTRLGHLELVRPRRGRPLAEALFEPWSGGALVKTAVAVAYEALRALRREARAQPGRNWRLIVASDVAAALAGGAARAVEETERRFARRVAIETDPDYDRERFQIASS
jgi:ribonuclease G